MGVEEGRGRGIGVFLCWCLHTMCIHVCVFTACVHMLVCGTGINMAINLIVMMMMICWNCSVIIIMITIIRSVLIEQYGKTFGSAEPTVFYKAE